MKQALIVETASESLNTVCSKLLFRGKRISAIAAISYDNGLLDCYSVTGTVDGEWTVC